MKLVMQGGFIRADGTHLFYTALGQTEAFGKTWYCLGAADGSQYSAFDKLDDQNAGNWYSTGFGRKKYLLNNADAYSKNPWYDLRYAEILLNYAEALANLETPNLVLAMQKLNEVRDRVGLSELSASTKNEVMEAIRQERKIELAFEGFHYWDCKRWGIAESTLGNIECHGIKITRSADSYSFTYESCDGGQQRIFPKKYYSLPIPASEIANNPECDQLPEWLEN